MTRQDFNRVMSHLFPGDDDEHAAVLLAGVSLIEGRLTLLVRETYVAREGIDYVHGKTGYRALAPTFIHRCITRARDERLVYLAIHNHLSDEYVGFSSVDLASHERGYPALLQIARGMPVGALVFGKRSIEADIWLPDRTRLSLEQAIVVGSTIHRLTPSPTLITVSRTETYDRQVRMFGKAGQIELRKCRVGIIGLGGIGSLVAEYLARLGVGHFCLIDDDWVEHTNLSRIIGASAEDAIARVYKVEVCKRMILQANVEADVQTLTEDVSRETVAKRLLACDFIFLAADSMRARLVFNAIVHQYFIPGVQLGSKIRCGSNGSLLEVMSANRSVRPGKGCLWCNQFIDPTGLAKEAKTDEERKAQQYGVEEPNPSVISLNAISASHAVNDFLLDYLCLRPESEALQYEHIHCLRDVRTLVTPRKDADCPECSREGRRFGRGDSADLPCAEG
ncbi:ThiF family adenylyltransferase [Nitrospira moscoviensis]|nr:ThiF family adenylyltransferase [Nitrospira moscoviensis]